MHGVAHVRRARADVCGLVGRAPESTWDTTHSGTPARPVPGHGGSRTRTAGDGPRQRTSLDTSTAHTKTPTHEASRHTHRGHTRGGRAGAHTVAATVDAVTDARCPSADGGRLCLAPPGPSRHARPIRPPATAFDDPRPKPVLRGPTETRGRGVGSRQGLRDRDPSCH